eukprot:scaffold68804_cov61-Phaeocystis_antarctica.AAC.3
MILDGRRLHGGPACAELALLYQRLSATRVGELGGGRFEAFDQLHAIDRGEVLAALAKPRCEPPKMGLVAMRAKPDRLHRHVGVLVQQIDCVIKPSLAPAIAPVGKEHEEYRHALAARNGRSLLERAAERRATVVKTDPLQEINDQFGICPSRGAHPDEAVARLECTAEWVGVAKVAEALARRLARAHRA